MAELGKQLMMAKHKPDKFLKQFIDQTTKKMKGMQKEISPNKASKEEQPQKGDKGDKYATSKDAALNALNDPEASLAKINKDIKAKQVALKQLDQIGDKLEDKADSVPSLKPAKQKIQQADDAIKSIFDNTKKLSDHIFKQFKQAAKNKNLKLMQAAQGDFIGFNKYSSNVIKQANAAFSKGAKNPSEFDKILKLANDFKAMAGKMMAD